MEAVGPAGRTSRELTPEKKIEIVREIFAASNAHQRRQTAHHFHDDLEYDGRGLGVPDFNRIYRGTEEVRGFWREWFEAWKHIQTDLVWIKTRVIA